MNCPECGYPDISRTFDGCWRANLNAECRRKTDDAWQQGVKPKVGGRPRTRRRLSQLRKRLLS